MMFLDQFAGLPNDEELEREIEAAEARGNAPADDEPPPPPPGRKPGGQ